MRGISVAALASLAGLVVCVVLFSYFPLPPSGTSWQSGELWLSILFLGVGLVCFLIVLISGLIILLNWGSERRKVR